MSEEVLDEENWKLEAAAIVNDIKDHVKYIDVSKVLQCSNQGLYFNLTTLEGDCYSIELSGAGFCVVGHAFDTNDISSEECFETPYSLLNSLSDKFKESFGNKLMGKLQELQDN